MRLAASIFAISTGMCLFLGHARGQTPQSAAGQSAFGSTTQSTGALIGILYDLKQTQQRRPAEADYSEVVGRFTRERWDEQILNAYYRVTQALFATEIYIPYMDASNAPRAFGAERTVDQRKWVIHYKGQVSPPHAGTFRFLGLSDDIMAVAVQGRTVLVAEHPGAQLLNHGWRPAERNGPQTPVGAAIYGDWITLQEGEVIDLDIIIGENPGGNFGAWLLVEEQGRAYPAGPTGEPVYPAFQLASRPVPHEPGRGPVVRAAAVDELWRGLK